MNTDKMPTQVNILGSVYSISYVDNPADVDIFKRDSMWGQIDYWTRTIRIYARDMPFGDVWEFIIHEVLHGIVETLHIKVLQGDENHDALDLLGIALVDTFIRNGWLGAGE